MRNPRLNALTLMTIDRYLLEKITADDNIVKFEKRKEKKYKIDYQAPGPYKLLIRSWTPSTLFGTE